MIAAHQLTLWRGFRCLFERLDLRVADGQAVLVRGPNGSGKTTLLRVLAGLTRPESGHVTWRGANIEQDRAGYAEQLAYLGHATGLKSDLSVRHNLDFACRLRGRAPTDLDAALTALELRELLSLAVRHLSAGQQRRVALARVLGSAARLWLLDEPLTNLDASGRQFVQSAIQHHLAAGGAAVIATHAELDVGADRATGIELGVGA